MFALAGFTASARRTALVALALFVSLVAALMIGPAAAHAAPAQHHTHKHHLTQTQVIADSLLTMLNSCAPGVAVVNIDNGYGAGHLAAQIAAPPGG